MISATIFLPILAGLLVAALGKRFNRFADGIILAVSGGASITLIACLIESARSGGASVFAESMPWIADLGLNYSVAITPLNSIFLLLNAVLMPVIVWTSLQRNGGHPLLGGLLLVEQGLINGVFATQNLLIWFFFWELTLVPVFFLIKEFGAERRCFAAYKFFLYTLLGSLPMLLAFLFIYQEFGTLELARSPFALGGLAGLDQTGASTEFLGMAHWVFLGILLGVAVKLPLYPLHSWQPDAYTQAPTAVSMFLTGIMSKMGVYGLLLLLTLLPVTFQAQAEWIIWLAALTMAASITVAVLKNDLKESIAYSSLNHVAICALGVAVLALMGGSTPLSVTDPLRTGVLFQVFSHGLSGALFFFLAGVFENRLGTRQIGSMRGLRHSMPVFAGLLGVAAFATVGLPGLSGFIGEFLIFKGGFFAAPAGTALAFLGLIPMTMVMLKILHHLLNGPGGGESLPEPADMNRAERVAAMPLALLIVLAGLWPKIILWIWTW